ncbi:MAG: aminoglycoside phosphotransferase family protein [Persicimonas sp.]
MAIENMEERIRQALTICFDAEVAQAAGLENLGGHASLRIYWRVQLPQGPLLDSAQAPRGEYTQMAMVLPQSDQALKSEEGMSSQDTPPDELPFVNVHRYLDSIGAPVPDIDLVDMDLGVLLLEDLGDRTFEDAVDELRSSQDIEPEEREDAFLDLYREPIELLVDFQSRVLRSMVDASFGTNDDCVGFERGFDRELLRWELDHYLEWGLDARLQDTEKLDTHRDALNAIFDRLVDDLLGYQQTLVLRDYQSRNLMHKGDDWFIIDFQDALKGPAIYDLVALLRDSYIELNELQVDRLLHDYIAMGEQRGLPWCADEDAVIEAFYLQTIQRKLKDAGRFVYIDRVKGNPSFLQYYDSSIRYVKEAIAKAPGYDDLAVILEDVESSWSR